VSDRKTKAQRYRELLGSGRLIVAPGVYDGYSARLVQAAGFESALTSGAAIANAILGVEDIGIMGLHENLNHCRNLVRSVDIPITCDADNGYGNPLNVYHTIRLFEETGAAGVNIEDQLAPKRCGHMPGKEVIPLEEMVKKVEAACLARRDDAFVVVARTDAIAIEGIEGAVRRARAYARAGADMIFPDAVRGEDDIARIVEAAGIPVSINMGFGIRERPTSPLVPLPRLEALGVRRVSLPRMLPAAALHGMRAALEVMKEVIATGVPANRPDLLVSIQEIWELMDFAGARALEEKLLTTEQFESRYGAKAAAR
jgi:2-methylisocitrate lyase-like PEP mutase family enzyme